MNFKLTRNEWSKKDVLDFNKYLFSIRREDKIEFTKKTVNTFKDVLGIDCGSLRMIAKKIHQGDYNTYLSFKNDMYHESVMVNAYVISLIKDSDLQIKQIENNLSTFDNWAVVDSLKFNIKNSEEKYLDYAEKCLLSKDIFTRRVGVRILFAFIQSDNYYKKVFDIIPILNKEEEYYVNMGLAWLLCEMFIKKREETINYLKNNNLNSFAINKMISKCRDSYRVSPADKELLLSFKK